MNQIQQLIESITDAPHDAVLIAGMFTVPVLIALWIVDRMRHPQRGFLNALVIASVGIRASAVGVEHGPRPVGPHRRKLAASNLHQYCPLDRRLLGLAPLDSQRTTHREAYGGSCSSHGPSGTSGCPSIRSSG